MTEEQAKKAAKALCQKAYDDGKAGRKFEQSDVVPVALLGQFYDRGRELFRVREAMNDR